ncbi:MAG: hypothetical protein EP298_12215 [Gammaproteobacteria bacterium]|nr:MAG: hypothetical protein EP298_12215 [Gammaproteobacteria bacterium]UTW43059.1 hypothetical protein KFE69_02640 [bacterium SCSIO 12844]
MSPHEFYKLFINTLSIIKTLAKSHSNWNWQNLEDAINTQLIPFLDNLDSVITDSTFLVDHIQSPSVDYLKENFNDLYQYESVRARTGQLNFDAIFHAEMVLKCIFNFQHPLFNRFIGAFIDQLISDFPENKKLMLRLNVLHQIKKDFKLKVDLLSIDELSQKLESNLEQLAELQKEVDLIDIDEMVVQTSKTDMLQRFHAQRELLEDIAYLYCHGSNQYSGYQNIKKHDQKDFERIFGQYLDYDYGQPRLKTFYQVENFDFKDALDNLFIACRDYYLRFSSRQCGSIAEILKNEVNQNKNSLGIEVLTGDAREKVDYTYEVSKENLVDEYQQNQLAFQQSTKPLERQMLQMTILELENEGYDLLAQAQIKVSDAYQLSLEQSKRTLTTPSLTETPVPAIESNASESPKLSFLESGLQMSRQVSSALFKK